MAKVLLINSNLFKQPWPIIPFGLCSIAAAIEKEGHELAVLDLCFSHNCMKDMRNMMYNFKPDLVGISIRNIDNCAGYKTLFFLDQIKNEVVVHLKKLFSGPIIIGGPAVGISGREMLDFFDLEYAVRGDGEAVIVEFIKRVEKKLTLEGLKGLIIRKNGKIVQDPPPFFVKDVNLLPYSKPHKYLDLSQYYKFDSPLQIQTKRGCALKCSYCTYNNIEGHRYRMRAPESVAAEIEELVKETGIDHIEFTDSTFNIPLDHTKAVLRALIKKRLDLRLRTMGLNPGAIDNELADLMKEAGFVSVDLGAETGSDTTLKGLAKNYMKKDIIRAGELLQQRKIPVEWFLLLGAPSETRETLEETFYTITKAAAKWDLIVISIGVRVYKGSPISEKMKEEDPNCTKDNFLHPVCSEPEGISLNPSSTL